MAWAPQPRGLRLAAVGPVVCVRSRVGAAVPAPGEGAASSSGFCDGGAGWAPRS